MPLYPPRLTCSSAQERLVNYGSEALDTAEHLGLIIGNQQQAAALLKHFESIPQLARASVQGLLPFLSGANALRVVSSLRLAAVALRQEREQLTIDSPAISKGILNESLAHRREIFWPVITYSAHAFILVHNHPSGDPSPSEADLRLTRRILEASKILQLRSIEHIIIRLARSGPEQLFQLQRGRRQPIVERESKIVFPKYSRWEQCCECCRRRRPGVFDY